MTDLPASSPDPAIHRHRGVAESFGEDAERYDRARPRYPRELADAVLAMSPGRRVLDVGIGTGISALPFRDAGAEVSGVEIDGRMAALARARGFDVDVSQFEEWDGPQSSFDAVVAGQTWHWIEPEAGTAKAASLLRPGGLLVPFWNSGDPDPQIASEFAAVCLSSRIPFR